MLAFDLSDHPGGAVDLPGFGRVNYVTSDNGQRGEPFTPIKGLVMHWTAGDRMTVYAAYHWGIVDNGTVAALIRTLKPTEKGQHLWGRNTGLAGVSYAATADGGLSDYGPGAPTERQHQIMHLFGGEFCAWHNLDPRGENMLARMASDGSRIWATAGNIAIPVVACHQTYAIPDGYGADRWDTGKLCDPDRGGIAWVHDELKAGRLQFQLAHLL